MRLSIFGSLVLVVSAACTVSTQAACPLGLERVASGLVRPVGAAHPRDGSQRLFIHEQHTGRIRILDLATNRLRETPFLDIDGLATGGEQGLLGMAFAPDYVRTGLFYVNLTVSGGATQVRRYRVSRTDPDVADPGSMTVVLSFSQPYSNHNGGWIGFGPDGYLYIATGDGGAGFDPGNRAQDLSTLLGKLLRIDVNGTDGATGEYGIPPDNPFLDMPSARPEIWAYGLRNPWRCSFDRATGDLYIGDVGQGEIEEIDFQSGGDAGGANYGWRVMEGTQCSDNSQAAGNPPCDDPSLVPPIHEYVHPVGFSVTGGYVYRGAALGGLRGTYFFADYGTARIWSFRYDGGAVREFTDRTPVLNANGRDLGLISSFGVDERGELYLLDMEDGEVYKLISTQDPIPGDLNGDCQVDFADLNILAGNWMVGRD